VRASTAAYASRRDAEFIELMRDVAERGAGVECQRLIRIDMQTREKGREFVLARWRRRSRKVSTGGACERLGERDRLPQREGQYLTRGSAVFLLADEALRQRVFDRVWDDRQEGRVDGIESD